jgi:hypothetical protein
MTTPVSRRTLIKGAALVGGTAWVAPAIESFTARAAAASVQHACCACFDSNGKFVSAAADDFSDQGCAILCATSGPGISHGTFLRFATALSFVARGVTETDPGCTSPSGVYLNGLTGASAVTCPSIAVLPANVSCDEGTY